MCDDDKQLLKDEYQDFYNKITNNSDLSGAERDRFKDAFRQLYRAIKYADARTITQLKAQFEHMRISYDLYCQNISREKIQASIKSDVREIKEMLKSKRSSVEIISAVVRSIFGLSRKA